MNDSKLLSKIPFLWIFLGLGLIGSVLFKISGYELANKQFPIEYFIWAFVFAGILILFIKIFPNVNARIIRSISNFLAIYILVLFVVLSGVLLYQFIKLILANEEKIQITDTKNGLAIENLKTFRREINFNYDYNSSLTATLAASFIPLDDRFTEYPGLIKGKKLSQGKNNIIVNFGNLSWDYLNNEEIELIIRLILSVEGGKEKNIEELHYKEEEGIQHTTKHSRQ